MTEEEILHESKTIESDGFMFIIDAFLKTKNGVEKKIDWNDLPNNFRYFIQERLFPKRIEFVKSDYKHKGIK